MASSGIGIDDESMIATTNIPNVPRGFSTISSHALAFTSHKPIFFHGTPAASKAHVKIAPLERSAFPQPHAAHAPSVPPADPAHAAESAESPPATPLPPPDFPADSQSASPPPSRRSRG